MTHTVIWPATAPELSHDRDVESLLDRELYSETEAARLLRLAPSTLHWWLEGGERRGRSYRPVLRVEPTGSRSISWAEFIEAGLLRQYRRVHQVPLPELRKMIDILRDEWGAHPLVHQQPYVGAGRRLLVDAQEEAGLRPAYKLIAPVDGQLVLLPPAESFVEKVEWDRDLPVRWRPHTDLRSPVRIDPEIRFGRPAVGGISTEVIWEHVESDESFDEVAEEFELSADEVRWAYAYEISARAA
ncbi:MAG: DUF433 domain-containing protein [Acidimicrobiales bacterium]